MEDARSQLEQDLFSAMQNLGINAEDIKARIYIVLNRYEIIKRSTEIVVYEGDAIEKYIRLFLVNKRVAGRTERTLGMYKASLNAFFDFIQKNPVEITADDIKYFLAIKEERDHASKVYLQNLLRAISSFYAWMMKEEYISKNPLNKCDPVKVPKIKKKAFSEIEVEKIRMVCQSKTEKMIIELLLSTGCRVSEIAGIKLSEIDGDKILVHGKGQKDRYVYLSAPAQLALTDYLGLRKDSNPYLFPKSISGSVKEEWNSIKKSRKTLSDWVQYPNLVSPTQENAIDCGLIESKVRRVGKRAGVVDCHPHRFRRTCATLALKRGMPVEYVSKMLGHENLSTTQIYLDLDEDELKYQHQKYVG